MTNAVKQAVALAERVTPPESQEIDPTVLEWEQKAAQLSIEITQLQRFRQQMKEELLGVEAVALRKIDARIEALGSKRTDFSYKAIQARKECERNKNLRKRLEVLASRFHRLSWEPFKWRDAEGFPRLVIFTLNSPNFRIRIDPDDRSSFVLEELRECYADVIKLLRKKRTDWSTIIELVCQFEGLIPVEVRQQIREAKSLFGDDIFIIAEPGKFQLNEIVSTRRGDPLVVGYDTITKSLWLIAAFDTTTVEEAMFRCLPREGE